MTRTPRQGKALKNLRQGRHPLVRYQEDTVDPRLIGCSDPDANCFQAVAGFALAKFCLNRNPLPEWLAPLVRHLRECSSINGRVKAIGRA